MTRPPENTIPLAQYLAEMQEAQGGASITQILFRSDFWNNGGKLERIANAARHQASLLRQEQHAGRASFYDMVAKVASGRSSLLPRDKAQK